MNRDPLNVISSRTADAVALANHRYFEEARQRAAANARRAAKARDTRVERALRPVPESELGQGVSISGKRLVVPAGDRDAFPVPVCLSYAFARVSPSCGRGRWVVQRAVSALLGGNLILWTKRAVTAAGTAPGGGELFRIAVPRGLRPAFDGVAVTVIESGVRAAHRVEFLEVVDPPLPPAGHSDGTRVGLAWRETETTLSDHTSHERLQRARRTQPYEAAAAIAVFDSQAAGWEPAGEEETTDGR